MSVAPLSDLQRNKGAVRWAEHLEAPAAAQGSRPISQGGKSASSHPDGIRAQPQRVPVAGADTVWIQQDGAGTSMQGDLASSKPLPATDILGTISTQIK